jgi:hypothetical protein
VCGKPDYHTSHQTIMLTHWLGVVLLQAWSLGRC